MIPAPPLDESGHLAANQWTVLGDLVPGILVPCCACGSGSAFHWDRDGVFVALHEACIPRLIAEWKTMVASGEAALPAMSGVRTGAYARRAVERRVATARAVSRSLGSPFFRPGMPEGTPWVAVAEMPDRALRVSPCGPREASAREVCAFWRGSAERGMDLTFGGGLPLGGWVCDPFGYRSDQWTTPAG